MSFASFILTRESRIRHRDAIEDSESTRVARKFEEQEKVTETVANNDSSKPTPSKQESPVVSAILATACIAAVAFEAAAESRHKERSEHAEVKRDDRNDVAHDRDSPVRRKPLTIEQNVAVNRTVQQTVADSPPMTVRMTPAVVTLGETQTDIRRSRFVK